jgi:hypothetical protein
VAAGARPASALNDGFAAAFHIEAGIFVAAAVLALLLLGRARSVAGSAWLGKVQREAS